MNCENYLCIYENDGKCNLNDISLDVSGQCTSCIYVSLTQEELEQVKGRTLNSTEKN